MHSTGKRPYSKFVVTALGAAVAMSDIAVGAEGSGYLEEVTVTAGRRVETVQSIPISVSVIDDAAMAKSALLEFEDLADRIPGLTFAANGLGQTRYFIRGIGQFATNQSPTTGVYFDETPLQVRTTTGYFQPEALLYDLERVEVLRGPQGTLFGSSSMGGSIRFISKRPDADRFAASTSLGVASTRDSDSESYTAKGMVNLPIVDGKFAVRLVGLHDNQAGWLDDVRPVTSNLFENVNQQSAIIEDVNSTKTNAVRITAAYTPNETLRIIPTLYMQEARTGVNKPQSDEIFGEDARQRARWLDEHAYTDLFTGNLLVEKDSGALGGVTFLSSSTYLDAQLDRLTDLSSLPQPQFSTNRTQIGFYSVQDVEQWTQDFRLVSRGESPFQYVLGVYYGRTSTPASVINRVVNDWGGGLPLLQRIRRFDFTQTEYAAYGEGSYRLGDFKASVGGRYFNYRQSDSRFQQRPAGVDFDFTQRGDEDGFSPRVVLGYSPSARLNYYISYSEGFRTGGVNVPITEDACPRAVRQQLGIPDVPPPFKSDKTKNYEIGAKISLSQAFSVNAAVYQIDWTDYQQSVSRACGGTSSFSYSGNAGSVESKGFEAEMVLQPVDTLRLTGGVGMVDAQFNSSVRSLGIRAGEALWDVPKWTYSATAEYTVSLTGALDLSFGADANHVDASRSGGSFLIPPPTRERYTMVNANANLSSGNWNLSLYMNNLSDVDANYGYDFIPGSAPQPGVPDRLSQMTARPRTIGLVWTTSF